MCENEQIFNFKEACEFLRFSENTVRRMVAAQEIPVYRVHNRLRFLRSELIEWTRTNGGVLSE